MVSSLVDPYLSLQLEGADAILCDLDGCLISGDHIFPDACDFIEQFRSRLWVVSNNSSDTAASLADRLRRHGVNLPANRIVLAGEETVRRLAAALPGARVAVHASPAIGALAHELGLHVTDDDVEAVVLGRDPAFVLRGLGLLISQLRTGASLHVTNLDLTHPSVNGTPVPETGALLAALCACLPILRFHSIGKPDRTLLDIALERAGAGSHSTVFIGDNLVTDGAAAALAGMRFIHLVRPVTVLSDDVHARPQPVPQLAGTPC